MKEVFRVTVNELAAGTGEPLPPSETVLMRASSLANPCDHSIIFVKDVGLLERCSIDGVKNALILVPLGAMMRIPDAVQKRNIVAPVQNPRLSYARLVTQAVSHQTAERRYVAKHGASIEQTVRIPGDLYIEPGAFVDHDVIIGSGVRILAGAVVRSYTTIGDGSTIHERAVVGTAGFGFERDQSGIATRLPHLGGVTIGKDVEIGSLTNVCAGTIDPTLIHDGVKISGLCHIAHNCHIGSSTMIAGSTVLCGSVHVGEHSWLGPNSVVIEGRCLGRRVTVGIGAVVLRDVEDDDVVAGNPARSLRGKGSS